MDHSIEKVISWLDAHRDAMVEDLMSLLAIDSVRGESEEKMPFGPGPAAALDFCLKLGEKQGFRTENMEGYVGTVDLHGAEPTQIGILSHVDVVPAEAADWRFPPFSPEIAEGRIFGRGVIDDKGPLIACQYALCAIRECAVPLKRSVRHIIGTNEETGMACIEYYAAHCKNLPEWGFAPDAVYPVVAGEKGLLRWTCTESWENDAAPTHLRLISLKGGSGINSVPASACAQFRADEEGFAAISAACSAEKEISLERNGDTVTVTASGVAAHAAMPEKGDNAILKLLNAIAGTNFAPAGAKNSLLKIKCFLADILAGRKGIVTKDECSAMTNVLSLIDYSEACGEFSCDTRYPVTADGKANEESLCALAAEYGFTYNCWLAMDSLYYPADHPLIATLLETYAAETGEKAEPCIIGSGTYARKLPGFAAFGPLFPGQENITHQADERMALDDLFKLARIYAKAIIKLANSTTI